MTRALEDRPNGATRLEMRVERPRPKDKDFVDRVGAKFAEDVAKAIGPLQLMLDEQTSVAPIDEPPLMPANARFLTEPVKSGAAR
jgi:hypothetical protein